LLSKRDSKKHAKKGLKDTILWSGPTRSKVPAIGAPNSKNGWMLDL